MLDAAIEGKRERDITYKKENSLSYNSRCLTQRLIQDFIRVGRKFFLTFLATFLVTTLQQSVLRCTIAEKVSSYLK